ncbi:cobalamin-binding protein [uncultured Piscinibacter sp.]|uniref:cobalamin-binding protein n=1 Tax=uncultured Piscinibacter sp. TaxID=1131835 RepID=UPI00260DB7B8|nr:cobalamin-binding protein [uncultured Piscinibacter sp.]
MLRRALLIASLILSGPVAWSAVQVRDDGGATITLSGPARRIVSLAPHLTELLFAAGAGGAVVGVGAYSDFPEAAKALPRVGDSAMLDLERIVALKPDLLVVWRDGNSPQQLQRLATLGIPVYASELGTLADIAGTLRRFGRLAGTEAAANARADRFEAELGALRERHAGRPPLRVFYQIWHRPLLTVNGRHLISEGLALCGARNVFAALAPLTPTVSEEAVVAIDPDVIVTGRAGRDGPDGLDTWRRFGQLRATRHGALLVVDSDTLHRSSDRIVEGIRDLCEKLDGVRRAP